MACFVKKAWEVGLNRLSAVQGLEQGIKVICSDVLMWHHVLIYQM